MGKYTEHKIFHFNLFFFWLCHMWDPNSLNGDQTCVPAVEVQCLNQRTARELPILTFLKCAIQRH